MKKTEKQSLRQQVLALRDGLTDAERASRSASIAAKIQSLPEFQQARIIMAYMSIGAEFQTLSLVRSALKHGARLVLPRVDRAARQLRLYYVNDLEHDLEPGVWNILEPKTAQCEAAPIEAIDFILVPGAAFDAGRNRLGYGGGFFDRLLGSPQRRAVTVAAAYHEQIVPEVPMEPHDCQVDVLVTDQSIYR